MDPQVAGVLDEVGDRGFAVLEGLVPPALVGALMDGSAAVLSGPAESWDNSQEFYGSREWRSSHFASPGRASNFMDCLGNSATLDHAIEALLGIPQIQELIRAATGSNPRLWFASVRRVEPGSAPLPVHQDVPGEVGLCVLLTDTRAAEGSIAFVPGSHKWPRALHSSGIFPPHRTYQFMHPAVGAPGDIVVFLHKTWHGRMRGGSESATAVILTFVPAGPRELGRRPPATVVEKLGPSLQRFTRPAAGTLPARVDGETRPAEVPWSIQVENLRLSRLSPWRLMRLLRVVITASVPLSNAVRRVRRWSRGLTT